MSLLARAQEPNLLQAALYERRVRSTFIRRYNDCGRNRPNSLGNERQLPSLAAFLILPYLESSRILSRKSWPSQVSEPTLKA